MTDKGGNMKKKKALMQRLERNMCDKCSNMIFIYLKN